MREILPVPVYESIARHLRSASRRAQRSWEVNRAAEDSLTGAAFAEFTTYRTRRYYSEGHEWRWRIKAYKFVSGGEDSEEKVTGADGIIEIEVRHFMTGRVETKALLVQAKKAWTGKSKKLQAQVSDMERLVQGSSAALDYLPTGYVAVSGREVLAAEGSLVEVGRSGWTSRVLLLCASFLRRDSFTMLEAITNEVKPCNPALHRTPIASSAVNAGELPSIRRPNA